MKRRGPKSAGIRPIASLDGGFTLIEVLIALSVLGVTMTTVFALFSSGLKLREVTRDRMAFERDSRLVFDALSDDFANLVPSTPEPMVSADCIVLWRQSTKFVGGGERLGAPELVTYQWSGSAFQDSLLVRVVVPLDIDVTDRTLVHREFMRWARFVQGMEASVNYLLREGPDSRFGSRATLNGASGTWTAFPGIHGFVCGISEPPPDDIEAAMGSRVRVRLSPDKTPTFSRGLDPLTRLALLPQDGPSLEMSAWLPLGARYPVPLEEILLEEDLP